MHVEKVSNNEIVTCVEGIREPGVVLSWMITNPFPNFRIILKIFKCIQLTMSLKSSCTFCMLMKPLEGKKNLMSFLGKKNNLAHSSIVNHTRCFSVIKKSVLSSGIILMWKSDIWRKLFNTVYVHYMINGDVFDWWSNYFNPVSSFTLVLVLWLRF